MAQSGPLIPVISTFSASQSTSNYLYIHLQWLLARSNQRASGQSVSRCWIVTYVPPHYFTRYEQGQSSREENKDTQLFYAAEELLNFWCVDGRELIGNKESNVALIYMPSPLFISPTMTLGIHVPKWSVYARLEVSFEHSSLNYLVVITVGLQRRSYVLTVLHPSTPTPAVCHYIHLYPTVLLAIYEKLVTVR